MVTVAKLNYLVSADTSKAENDLKKVDKAFDSAGKSSTGFGASLQRISGTLTSVGGSLTTLGASMVAGFTAPLLYAVKQASDFSESMNKVNVTFGASAATVISFAQTSATSLGLSKNAALDAAGGFGNMFNALGLSKQAAADMSVNVLQLSADLSSFHNIEPGAMLDKLRAGLVGEIEPLRSVGILINEAAVKAKAMELGLGGASKQLDEKTKVLVRYQLILDQAKNAQGDFARTSDGVANQMRIVRAQIGNLAAELGAEFLPMVQKALGFVNNWIISFSALDPSIKKVITTVIGFGAVLAPVILGLGLAATAIGTLLSPVGLVAAAVGALALAFATNFGGIRDTVTKWANSAKQYYLDHKDELDNLGKKVKEVFDTYIKDISKAATDLVSALDKMKTAIDGFSTSNDGSWKLIVGAMKAAGLFVKAFFDGTVLTIKIAVKMIEDTWKLVEFIIINPIKNAIKWVKDHIPDFHMLGNLIGEALKTGHGQAVFQSPYFITHWLMEAAAYAQNEAPTEFGKAGTKMGDKLKEGFTAALGNINEFLGRAIGGTGTISDSVFDIILRKFPEVATALGAQATSFRETNKAIELYAVLMTTAEGRNTAFAQAVRINIQLLRDNAAALNSEIVPSFADLGGAIEEVTIITKQMGDAIANSVGLLAESTINSFDKMIERMISSKKAAAEWGKVMSEGVRKLKDEIKDNLGDGVGGVLIELAKKFNINLSKVNDWSSGILDIVGSLPGKFGEKLRGVTSKVLDFVNGLDRTLKGLHKIFDSIPNGLSGMIDSIAGIFKSKTPAAAKTWDDFLGGLNKSTQKGMSGILGTLGKAASAAAGILGGIGTFMGSRNQGKVAGVLGGAMGGMATGAAIGSLFGPGPGTAIGAGIGAAAGAILGLFGTGKSKEQKRAEEEAKQRASLDMQRAAADIMGAQMEGLKKGLELLEGLQGFAEVPRKAIKRFFNQIEMILQLFAEMAGKFKADSIAASKTLTESMGESFGFLLSGSDLINAIKQVATISETNINDFISTTVTIIKKWSEAASLIEMQSVKMTGKISDKLKTSFDFLGMIPGVIKGFSESVKVDDSQIDSVFATAQKFIVKMKEMSEAQRGLELNKAGASAGIFSSIFEASKGMLDFIKQLSEYKPLDDALLAIITNDLNKVLAWGDSLTAIAESGIAKFETAQSAIARLAAAIRGTVSGISALSGGIPAAGITANIQTGNGASLVRGEGGGGQTVINHNYYGDVNNNISFRELEEIMRLPNAIEVLQRRMNELQSPTGGYAQSRAGY